MRSLTHKLHVALKNSYCFQSRQKFCSSIVKSFCIALKYLFYSCCFSFRLHKFWAMPLYASECMFAKVLFFLLLHFPGSHFHCFQKNIKSIFVCFAIDENKKRAERGKRRKKVSRISFPFVLSFSYSSLREWILKQHILKFWIQIVQKRRWSIMIVFAGKDATWVSHSHSFSLQRFRLLFFDAFLLRL